MRLSTQHRDALEMLAAGRIAYEVPLSAYSTWRIGGPADVLIEPTNAAQLSRVLACTAENRIPVIVIGDGSNVLFADAGFRGVVVRIGRAMAEVRIDGETVSAQAGVAVPRLARAAAVAGLTGLEHTAGIPGSLGGLVAMNGGSLRQNIGQAVEHVYCLDAAGNSIEMGPEACDFSYRHSVFLDQPWSVTDVVLKLQRGQQAKILHRMREVLRQRRHKFPRRLPNCGSVFKSDTDLHARCGPPGWIIEQTGLKGLTIGGAQVSTQHANFIVNTAAATAADVLELIRTVRRRVHQAMGVWLECEVRYVHPNGRILPAHLATAKD
jgi:UDP-N-acetylmuramate dehydrogenase